MTKNIVKTISKNLNSKYSLKLSGNLIGNKIAEKITKVSIIPPQHSSKAFTYETENVEIDRKIPKERYISTEKKTANY